MTAPKKTASSSPSAKKLGNLDRFGKRSVGKQAAQPKDGPRAARMASVETRPNINDLAATQPLATVKARLSEFVERVHKYRERITITRNGVPVAVLVDP